MVKININGVEHDSDDLSDEVKAEIAMLTTVDRQINANQQERAILQTARMAYARRIQELLPNLEISETEPENLIVEE
jgi:hypothetical protein